MVRKYLVTNFAYGTGPYLRVTELAIALNREREALGRDRLGIIVPHVYGEKQRRIMLEEFSDHEAKHPGEIVLDAHLGDLLRQVFYGSGTYEESLRIWLEQHLRLSEKAQRHLSSNFLVQSLLGVEQRVIGKDIILELARAPRIIYGIAPAYHVTFGYISQVLEHVLDVPFQSIALDRDLTEKAATAMRQLETSYAYTGIAVPGTFTHLHETARRCSGEELIPPTISLPTLEEEPTEKGIHVTITGIPGLERLYREAANIGLKLYSNDIEQVQGSEYRSPHVLLNPNIQLHFARSGWGSVWLSLLTGVPFVTPAFDSKDDPEIFFNNTCIEQLGLGIVFKNQSLEELITSSVKMKLHMGQYLNQLRDRFGMLDGNTFAARRIARIHGNV